VQNTRLQGKGCMVKGTETQVHRKRWQVIGGREPGGGARVLGMGVQGTKEY
jgi:hypothetical protein